MGADGGICWVYLNKPFDENREKLRKLLPWHLIIWDKYYDDPGWEGMGNDLFRNEIPGGVLEATYGSFQGQSLMELNEIIYSIDEIIADWGSDEVTLAELLECAKVNPAMGYNPETWAPYHYKAFNEMLLESFEYQDFDKYEVLKMTVGQWRDAVKECCLNGQISVCHVETWT